ncbi:MAG TPA: RnfABCDGE type electron transport complex subunit D [Thermoanaerobaculia bacterium]|nr:RnfABCDGE type electron transport complex subunit D [Thermoanaerobaculia bacterium]
MLAVAPLRPSDPRLFQIASLAILLAYGMAVLSFDVTAARALLLVATALVVQLACTRLARLPAFDPWSALISALSLCLLLRTNSAWLAAAAAAGAIASKFLFRWNGKHLFNPTNFALAAAIAVTGNAWVSPGQWGSAAFFAFGIACVGRFVVQRAARGDVTLAYIVVSVLFVTGRSLALGEPLGIPLHRLESGALLLFAFFMISDPKTTPDSRIGRILFGALVAAGAAYIQFRLFRPNGAIWSLAFFSLFVPLFDLLWPGPRWTSGVAPFPRKGDLHASLLRLRPRPDSLVRRPLPASARLLRLLRGEGGREAL